MCVPKSTHHPGRKLRRKAVNDKTYEAGLYDHSFKKSYWSRGPGAVVGGGVCVQTHHTHSWCVLISKLVVRVWSGGQKDHVSPKDTQTTCVLYARTNTHPRDPITWGVPSIIQYGWLAQTRGKMC